MKADKEEVLQILKKVDNENRRDSLVLIEQAAVEKEKLTSSPHQNIFLQEIQEWIECSKKNLEGLKEKHEDPELTDPNEIIRIKNAILMNKQDIDSLNRVIDLPKKIIDDGNRAKFSLASLFTNKQPFPPGISQIHY